MVDQAYGLILLLSLTFAYILAATPSACMFHELLLVIFSVLSEEI